MPLFKVTKDRISYMITDSPECIYDKEILKNMQDAGYKFQLNEKPATVSELVKYKQTYQATIPELKME